MQTILIITDNLPNQINGVVTTFNNIERLGTKNGYNIRFITPLEFYYFDLPKYPEVKISSTYNLEKKIKQINPDYIHIATEGSLGIGARLICDRLGWKYNTSYHTKFPEFVKKIYGIPEELTYMFLRWFHKHSGRVLTTTNTMVAELKDHGFVGEIIPWTRGVDRENLKPTIKHTKNKTPVVLYVGRVSKEKGLDDLCELQDKFTIEIVGDGPYRKELEQRYPNVKFLGYKTGSELADCYTRADVFAFPSKTDTFGIVIIEALSLGTPVAAYPVPGPIDILENSLTGYMEESLELSIIRCLTLNRDIVHECSLKWTWENCWAIFRDNLIEK